MATQQSSLSIGKSLSIQQRLAGGSVTANLEAVDASTRQDTLKCLSAVPMGPEQSSEHGKGHAHHDHEGHRFPLPLLGLVIILTTFAGFVVVGFNLVVIYSGCPLGINGCNKFHKKEQYGFLLLKALKDYVHEEVVYIVVAGLGALAVIQIIMRLPPQYAFQVSGGGSVQSLEAVATGYVIPLPTAFLRPLASVIYCGSGGPLGMEGPIIQICTTLAGNAGWAMGVRAAQTQSVLASLGFACGFAASFNSPLAGILFAMEELQHVSSQFSRAMVVMIFVASIVPTVVLRTFKGNVQHFYPTWGEGIVDGLLGENMWMLVAIPLAAFCSVLNLFIVLGLRYLSHALEIIHLRWTWLPATVTFTLQALLIACSGALVFRVTGLRGIWGIGAESIQDALTGKFHIYEYLLFASVKCLAMIIAVTFRAPGDVLEPVLITGAFIGGGTGRCLMDWFNFGPEVISPCVIFGMVSLFTSCCRFPLTPVLIVIELMGSETYALVVPMVLASFTAMVVSSGLCCPILHELMTQDGIQLHGHHHHPPDPHLEESSKERRSTSSRREHPREGRSSILSTISPGLLARIAHVADSQVDMLARRSVLLNDYDWDRRISNSSQLTSISAAPVTPKPFNLFGNKTRQSWDPSSRNSIEEIFADHCPGAIMDDGGPSAGA